MDYKNNTGTDSKTEGLSGNGLEVLHRESREWLGTIAFWKDEIDFFEGLLAKKKKALGRHSEYGKILKDMDRVHAELFDYLFADIEAHESYLARLLKREKMWPTQSIVKIIGN